MNNYREAKIRECETLNNNKKFLLNDLKILKRIFNIMDKCHLPDEDTFEMMKVSVDFTIHDDEPFIDDKPDVNHLCHYISNANLYIRKLKNRVETIRCYIHDVLNPPLMFTTGLTETNSSIS